MKITAKIPPRHQAPPVDKGVFIGMRTIRDKSDTIIGVFNVYAARHDLTDDDGNELLLTFNDAVAHMKKNRHWNGHDVAAFAREEELYAALRRGTYDGEWFIPTFAMILENLRPNRDCDGLKGTFNGAGDQYLWYWSCTEAFRTSDTVTNSVTFRNLTTIDASFQNNKLRFAVRPVRLERVT